MNNTILITGASSGIGKATAKLFQEKGWNVIATMRNPEGETELAGLNNILLAKLDVLDPDAIEKAIEAGIDRFGKIDVVLNNAGYGAFGPLEAFTRDNIIRQFNTNVIGLLDVTRAVLPHFRSHKGGTIINISSIGGKMSFPLGALYHGTKFAVEGISEALSYELEQFGAKIKIVEPGAIATDFAGRSLDFSNDESLTEYQWLVGKINEGMPAFFENASPASLVAEVIYQAATDGTIKLRYTAGDDAKAIIDQRQQSDDDTFIHEIKKQFKLV
ncbi:SDR family oxidoreductase [Mucilaginibacter gossypii]|uniref:NADP-dependent 3-hydroxy acid dehydrogenase YdfG n=1 Tax=Mucilaginibacter gossypii TaxID=551996 RepID=A0A1G8AIP9_9SPHI|nr:SDR family oxidoreductase [Mucilaginibacter gossypii]SDH20759.1 NADP-dependent 3-hydroxy acid dehydrogenase YdfG [Mucilaginibacter gossypii]